MNRIVQSWLLVFFLACSIKESRGNSGVDLVITKPGLDFAARKAFEAIDRKIIGHRVDEMSGKIEMVVGYLDYEFSNNKISRFTRPTADVDVNPGVGLTLRLTGAGLSFYGEWSYKYKLGFPIRDSGSFTASMSGVAINISISLGRNFNGSPSIKSTSCHCSIEEVHFEVSGGASLLYNPLKSLVYGKIRRLFEGLLCSEARKFIDVDEARALAMLNTKARIGGPLVLDYGLSDLPVCADGYVEFHLVGRFLNDAVVENAPKMQVARDRMVGVSVSDVALNSGLRVLFKTGFFRLDKDLKNQGMINVILHALSSAGLPYKGMRFTFSVVATSSPVLSIRNAIVALDTEANLGVDCLFDNGTRKNLDTVKINIKIQIEARIHKGRIVGSAVKFSLEIDQPFPKKMIRALEAEILPELNAALAVGFPLPTLDGFGFTDSDIRMDERYILVATNVRSTV